MRAKTDIRNIAEKLRIEQGLSYAQISRHTGISKSTLSGWLKEISLTPEQQFQLQGKMNANRASFAARAWSINRIRYQKAQQKADQVGMQIFTELPKLRGIEELSLAMLYLGEGSKSYGRVQIASTQVAILRYFLTTLIRLYKIDETRLSFRLNLVKAAGSLEKDFLSWWKTELLYPNARFTKTQYDPRSNAKLISDDYHGVCTLTYHDTYLQRQLISLATVYISSNSYL